MKKIAILASGSGTNAENIYKFFSRGNRIEVSLVIYDRKDAGVADRMKQYGVETVYIPGSVWRERPQEILNLLILKHIDMVVLAGFLRMVPNCITEAYRGRILNIHPSLLPAYGGKGMYGHHVHESVIANGETKSGVTVHYVTPECDGGEILMQEEVEITPQDTAETLEAKIHPVEYSLYPRAIVAAFTRLEEAPTVVPPVIPSKDDEMLMEPEKAEVEVEVDEIEQTQVPPAIPAAQEWAEKLGIKYNPEQQRPAPGPQYSAAGPQYSAAGPQYSANPRYNAAGPVPPVAGNHPTVGDEPMPPTNLIWAVLATILCCTIPGIVAIFMSSKVSSRYYAGDIEGAKRASTATEWWVIASFILGILSATLYMPISLLFN